PAEAGLSRVCAEVVGSACMRLKIEKVLWGTSLSGAPQMDHCLKVEGLGKEVGEGDGVDRVARGDERAEVAGQGSGVAGDVDHGGRGNLREQRAGLRTKAGARRVEDNQIGARMLGMRRLAAAVEKIEGRGADRGSGCSLEVGGKRLCGGGSGLDGDHSLKALREPPSKEAHAREKVPGQRPAVAGGDPLNESVHQPAVHLKKCALVHAVVEIGVAIGEGGYAPLCNGPRL